MGACCALINIFQWRAETQTSFQGKTLWLRNGFISLINHSRVNMHAVRYIPDR